MEDYDEGRYRLFATWMVHATGHWVGCLKSKDGKKPIIYPREISGDASRSEHYEKPGMICFETWNEHSCNIGPNLEKGKMGSQKILTTWTKKYVFDILRNFADGDIARTYEIGT